MLIWYLPHNNLKTSMNVMVIMSVIKSVLTLKDLLCVHVMMVICYKMMEGVVKVKILNNMTQCTEIPICSACFI